MTAIVYALMPALARFDALAEFRRRLVRADALPRGAAHELAASACFHGFGNTLPAAALVREYVARDAGEYTWLCADLAHVEPDMTGVRMLASGNLDVTASEAEALAQPLRPLFGDNGMLLETTLPSRWHLRVRAQTPMPSFDPPGRVLGDDLIDHLPAGDTGRHWRQLLNEAQVLLHHNPANRARAARGKPTANSLWLWGAGTLPAHVTADVQHVYGDDPLLIALAARAGLPARPWAAFDARERVTEDTLLDLGQLEAGAAADAVCSLLDRRRARALVLHFAGGERWHLRRGQRWRFWRRIP